MSRPFSPEEALSAKIEKVPAFVIDAVNHLLAQRFNGQGCLLRQGEVIQQARELAIQHHRMLDEEVSRDIFFREHWLDFEPIYRQRGWRVQYDKPGWDETYEPFWKFERNA